MSTRLTLVRNGASAPSTAADERVIPADALKSWVLGGGALVSLARYHESRVLTPDLTYAGRPIAMALLARWCTRGPCYLEDEHGRRHALTVAQLARWCGAVLREPLQRGSYIKRFAEQIAREEAGLAARPRLRVASRGTCAYFRTDLSYAVRAGGSVGHIAGVLNSLPHFGYQPVFVTTDAVPTVASDIEMLLVPRSERFWHYRELPAMVMHDVFVAYARRALVHRPLTFIYQRYSLHNFAGVVLSRERQIPFVVEYNGSESWVGQHWGHRLRYHQLADRVELLNLRAADLVVVVSDVIRDELQSRGVPSDRVLVNPNGVDVTRYSPQCDGARQRHRLGLGGHRVLGFIGTFGPWHGAEVLATAFVQLLARRPDLKSNTRLLMIGDGMRAAATRRVIEEGGCAAYVLWTGLVPQADGPEHLAACDVLVSPHVVNPDGSRFFGSPTKLFEYMAMGKAIAASDLEQIGQVLRDGDTALLVPPGDAAALSFALERLLDDAALRARLGDAARQAVVARWSWREHTRRILDALPRADERSLARA